MSQPAISRKTYLFTWITLMVLALATTLIGRLDLGPYNMPIAVLIATAKAALIVAFFMQAKLESRLVHVVIAAGVLWFLILLSNTLGDYVTRGWLPFPGK
ncbi:MAG: cytochrome C oxidase subunit IV family protein [Acidobacteriota bacterium]|nr:cytochrome C oxidase subunit IV family protein [Acidobacteriota bacterium]